MTNLTKATEKQPDVKKTKLGVSENSIVDACNDIFEMIQKENISNQRKLNSIKKEISKKYHLKKALTNIEILNRLSILPNIPKDKLKLFITKPTRTLSGVAVVAVMSYPFKCPHGKCITCPGGPKSSFGDVPQSYTGHEPATMRAQRNDYDPYLQTFNRLQQYVILNQSPEKVELIIMGGTFPSYTESYQIDFVAQCFKAMNDFSKMFYNKQTGEIDRIKFNNFFELPGDINDSSREKIVKDKVKKLKSQKSDSILSELNLEKEQKFNETTKIRCVGMTLETRPDYAKKIQGDFMLKLGCTRVELGIQSVEDDVLDAMGRSHSVQDSVDAISDLRDLGFKLNYHYMLGLPESNLKKDLNGLKTLFDDPRFRPDMMKIYPCMVIEGTKLYDYWKLGKFKPITTKQASKLIAEFLPSVPEYCRIMRVQRDIPTKMTAAGVDKTNLRQYVNAHKTKSRDIRAREPGTRFKEEGIVGGKPELIIREYEASSGREFFISLEDVNADIIYGFIRLRLPARSLRPEITSNSAFIRELHVYGSALGIGDDAGKGSISQHRGYGKRLLREAERISKSNNKSKLIIISGVGVRDYYRKQGYRKQGPYMVRSFVA